VALEEGWQEVVAPAEDWGFVGMMLGVYHPKYGGGGNNVRVFFLLFVFTFVHYTCDLLDRKIKEQYHPGATDDERRKERRGMVDLLSFLHISFLSLPSAQNSTAHLA
jgi:hypothetical protein